MAESPETFKVWIALLALCRESGIAECSALYLESICRLPLETINKAINELSSPDTNSRSTNDNGARIRRIDGGYLIINYAKYREYSKTDYLRDKMRKQREKERCSDTVSIPSASASASASCIKEGMQGGNDFSTLFLEFWSSYPRKEGKGAAIKAWRKIKSPKETLQLILIALEWQKQTEQWTKENGQYIPMPATYLNQQRWLDEKHKIILPTHILSAGEKQIQKERMEELNG